MAYCSRCAETERKLNAAEHAIRIVRDLAALQCEMLAEMMESGAGEDVPGHRLRQAARLIRELLPDAAPARREGGE